MARGDVPREQKVLANGVGDHVALRELIRACGFDLELNFVPFTVDEQEASELRQSLLKTPQERLNAMLKARGR